MFFLHLAPLEGLFHNGKKKEKSARAGSTPGRTCSLGPGLGAAIFFFFFFPVVKEPFEGCQMQEEHTIPFFIMRLLSLSRVARVKRGAESALERFEELQKEFKKSLFVGSAQFSLVV